jgi:hypothetical protein
MARPLTVPTASDRPGDQSHRPEAVPTPARVIRPGRGLRLRPKTRTLRSPLLAGSSAHAVVARRGRGPAVPASQKGAPT